MTALAVRPGQRHRGFTLLELLVVMFLLGVATLIAAGGADPLLRSVQERSWSDRLRAELVRTRGYARATGTVTVVNFLPEDAEVRFVRGPQTSRLPLPTGYRFDTDGTGSTQVPQLLFFPDGTASEMEIIFAGGEFPATRLRIAGISGKIELDRMGPPG